jgi:hypothetical protein
MYTRPMKRISNFRMPNTKEALSNAVSKVLKYHFIFC